MIRAAFSARREDFALACLLYTTHQLGESMVPVLVGATIAGAVAQGAAVSLALWLLVLAADFAVLSLSYRLGARASARAKQQAGHVVRLAVVERALRQDGGADLAPGDLLSRASSDADRVGALVGIVASSVAAVVALIAASTFLIAASPLLGCMIVLGALVVVIATSVLSRQVATRAGVEQVATADATLAAADIVRGLRTLAGLGAATASAERYRSISRRAVRSSERAVWAEAEIGGIAALLSGVYLTLIAGAGGWLALTGSLGLGSLVSVLGLAVFLTGPLGTLTGLPGVAQRAIASARRIGEVLERPGALERAGALDAGGTAPPRELALSITGDGIVVGAAEGELTGVVCVRHEDADRIAAAVALESVTSGLVVRVGGADARTVRIDDYGSQVLVAPHDSAVLDATLRENLDPLAEPELEPQKAQGAGNARLDGITDRARRGAWAAFADEIAESLPDGWDSAAGEFGRRLSGGQRQRLALARALAVDAPVLVLQEPTTAVDPATAEVIAERLRDLRSGSTTVVITTSAALLARCDTVVLVDGTSGTDSARCTRGTHDELLAGDTVYRAMVVR
ncbi:hypothetical protein ASE16_02475 [Leifsonia sp. Root227]|uniref:ABC transporter transmembrane domain-containing protein n=1 Tax=Leifsonia sp. Root227 TaxID=1736496 RepID=UPI0006FEE083|nr:ABC transporter ATP-binding protein [Leifsonia sp. Root227]KRC51953.1 hypothetical protein ASE16_02475 [Leifsonia sp. Root227]